jgi:DUF4097 and DUF4098 domain-containing protein YvlB
MRIMKYQHSSGNRGARGWWLVALLVTTGLAGVAPSVAGAQARADQEGRIEAASRTIRLEPPGLLDLSNMSGRITVTATGGRDIVIASTKRARGVRLSEGAARAMLSRVTIDIAERTRRVVVRTVYDRGPSRANGGVSVDYEVQVPHDTALELRSVSGDIEVRDVRGETRVQTVSGDLRLVQMANLGLAKTVSGDIEIRDGAAARDTAITSISGDLRVQTLRSPRVAVESVSGNLDLLDVRAERLDVGTVSGDVRFRGPLESSGRYELHSHSGTLRLELSGSGFDLEARTFSGAIDARTPVDREADTARGRRNINQVLRGAVAGGGAMLGLRTFSGDIVIARN